MSKIRELTWDYQIPTPQSLYALQSDWNHTILTKFNQIWTTYRSFNIVPVVLKNPNKFKGIIEGLVFYNKKLI